MLRKYFEKKRIRKFLTEMPRTLAKDYGRSESYTPGQVSTAVKKLGYDTDEFRDVAIAIYCNKEAAKEFGMDEALIKQYRGYPERHGVSIDHVDLSNTHFDTGSD